MVFVLDKRKEPLMPCTEKRARQLLERGRAVVHKLAPFTIRLKDRTVAASQLQPVRLKIDPGSKTSGIALVREGGEGQVVILHLAHLKHRSEVVTDRMQKRANYRRRRRTANLRYRPPRFLNRRRPQGWLTPSMRSRVGNVKTWVERYTRLAPITSISLELGKFDTQKMDKPDISGLEYQQGELVGYEIREYLLERWEHRCAYCGKTAVPLEVEHIIPKIRGGSDRVSNLTLACHACNQRKGRQTAAEFGYPGIQAQISLPLKDAAAINATRWALYHTLQATGLPLEVGTGGRTKWNRTRFNLPKTHALDAVCVGRVEGVSGTDIPVLLISAKGRGQRQRTNVTACGFPRGYRMRAKQVRGFQTGDLVRGQVPPGRKTSGVHIGRVAVRASGTFRVGKVDGINWRSCQVLQRNDGYEYALHPHSSS